MPQGIKQAIIAVWVTIGLSVLAALVNKWSGQISTGGFMFNIIVYSLFCIFPYKLSKGSNPARWIYTILAVMSVLFMLGGIGSTMPKADLVVSIIMIPIEAFIIFRLFQAESSSWFLEKESV